MNDHRISRRSFLAAAGMAGAAAATISALIFTISL